MTDSLAATSGSDVDSLVGVSRTPDDQLQFIQRLRERPFRSDRGLFWAEGPRSFLTAIGNGWRIRNIVYSRRLNRLEDVHRAVADCRRRGVRVFDVSPEDFRSVSVLRRASGIGATVCQRWERIESVVLRPTDHVVVVDAIRDGGNLGTILRTANAAGTRALVVVGDRVDPYDSAVVRASMGGIFGVPLVRASPHRFREWVAAQNVQCVGLSPEAGSVWDAELQRGPTAVVIGEERAGLSEGLRDCCRSSVSLPMVGDVDSLNVAVATGVMLYELMRRRTGNLEVAMSNE